MHILLLLYAMFCLEVKLVEHFVNYLFWISYLFDYLQGANVITFTVYVNLSSCLVLPVWRLYTSLRLFKLLEGSWDWIQVFRPMQQALLPTDQSYWSLDLTFYHCNMSLFCLPMYCALKCIFSDPAVVDIFHVSVMYLISSFHFTVYIPRLSTVSPIE